MLLGPRNITSATKADIIITSDVSSPALLFPGQWPAADHQLIASYYRLCIISDVGCNYIREPVIVIGQLLIVLDAATVDNRQRFNLSYV